MEAEPTGADAIGAGQDRVADAAVASDDVAVLGVGPWACRFPRLTTLRPRSGRLSALSLDALISLVERLQRADGSEQEQDDLLRRFTQSVRHSRAGDLIYWPERRAGGSFIEMTASEIVDAGLSYRATSTVPERSGGFHISVTLPARDSDRHGRLGPETQCVR